MSWSALDWASKQKTGSGNTKLVLLTLANFSDDENKCFPSFKTMMNITELSRSTIIRCIKSLKENKFIIVKERYESYLNDSQRQTSNMYYLQVGYQNDTAQYQNDTHVSITPKLHVTNNNKHIIYTDDFKEWWNLYPRKDGSKKKAFDLFVNITDKILNFDELYSFTVKYKQSVNDKEQKFIPHATTWLNQRRWETVDEKKKINLNQLVG
jgi:DNA-binding transcriptional regulator YhcF (GntR family)